MIHFSLLAKEQLHHIRRRYLEASIQHVLAFVKSA